MRLKQLRPAPLAFSLLLACATPAMAEVSIHFNIPASSIGLNLGGYPTLQPIPGYPVYYAPGVNSNFFFYDGMYWVYQDDNWYASSWYNGPWGLVDPYYVPDYVLRVPVRYYRRAPVYFRNWRADAPPRWDQHWGRSWVDRRHNWDRWDRNSSPRAAPLPTYQREYRGDRYPPAERQRELHSRNYRYQPNERYQQNEPVVRGRQEQGPAGNVTNVRPGETIQQRNDRLGAGG